MDFPGKFSQHILAGKTHILNVAFTVNGVKESFGGTGGNIAYNLTLLDETPKLIAVAGKDFSKVDRSGAYMARYVAKNVVAAGLAGRCLVQVAYAIGVAKPVGVYIDTYGTNKIDENKILQLVHKHFDFRPKQIIEKLRLKRPIYQKTAAYGHFGRSDKDFTWEATDKAGILRREGKM